MSERFVTEKSYFGYGLTLILKSEWSNDIAIYMRENDIKSLTLNGWKGSDLSFLTQLPELEAFSIIDFHIQDLSPVHILHDLKRLGLTTNSKTKIDFSQFPKLENCGIRWKANSNSLFDCTTLKYLHIDCYKGKDTDRFSNLVNLETLYTLNSSIPNVKGLKDLINLKLLCLVNLRVLESLAGIEGLSNLEELEVNTCRSIKSIEAVRDLTKLRILYIDNCGEIASLEPLRNLKNLRRLGFIESTNILDGDLSVLFELPQLELAAFQQRRHYTHKRDDFREKGIKA